MATILEIRPNRAHSIDYTMRSLRYFYPNPISPNPAPCRPLVVVVNGGEIVSELPCFTCSGISSEEDYFQFCQLKLFFHLQLRFPSVPACCAFTVADSFRQPVKHAFINHSCPRLYDFGFVATSFVEIELRRLPSSLERAIQESFEEAAFVRPATRDSVRGLFEARGDCDEEDDRFERCDQCVICFEEMETRKTTLTMPCSHVFHQDCLVKWLHNRNFCPLCRYQLPIDD